VSAHRARPLLAGLPHGAHDLSVLGIEAVAHHR
jgi:hypothetical protein